MLVLNRRIDQCIIISEEIVVKVIQVRGNRVKLGISCERSIPIRREEIPAPLHVESCTLGESESKDMVASIS